MRIQQKVDDQNSISKNGYSWIILLILLACQIFMSLGAYAWGPLGPFLIENVNLNRSQVGSLASIFFLGSVLAGIPAGFFVDRKGSKLTLVISLIIMGGGFFLLSYGRNYFMLLFPIFFAGIGYGTINQISMKSIINWFSSQLRSLATSIRLSGVSIGGALAALIIPQIANNRGWQFSVFLIGAIIIFISILVIFFFREAPVEKLNIEVPKTFEKRRGFIVNKEFSVVLIVGAFLAGNQVSITTFFVLYLEEEMFFTNLQKGISLTIVMISAGIFRIVWGAISDLLLCGERLITLTIILSIGLLGSILNLILPWFQLSYVVFAVSILLGASLLSWQGVLQTFVAEISNKNQTGVILGTFMTFSGLGIVISPVLFGLITDVFSYFWSWFMVMLSTTFSLIGCIYLKYRRNKINKRKLLGTLKM